ncbi:hypothetical protein V492_02615 [Pseudogymnoascus sp. VKM F-4246]|nr:hypothetical protein V492_02615 [Pseudogymnoascus sp. VKM F-4246]
MAEPIGITLAAIALADPVYERLSKLWKAYKASQVLGEEFYRSYLRTQEKTNKWKTQAIQRKRVRDLIELMVHDFNASYDIIEKYTNTTISPLGKSKGKGQEEPRPVSPTPLGSRALPLRPDQSLRGNPTAPTRVLPLILDRNLQGIPNISRRWGSSKPRISNSSGLLDSLSKFVSRSSSTGSHSSKASSGGTSNSTVSTMPSEAPPVEKATSKSSSLNLPSTSEIRDVQYSSANRVIVSDSNLEQENESQYNAKNEWDREVEHRQKLATVREKISWVHNGKEEFEALVDRLFELNQMLGYLLPKPEIPKPFEKIRNGREPPYLWGKSTEVRKALESANVSLRRVNRADCTKNLKVTVRLEEDHDETRRLLEQRASFFNLLKLRNDPLAFRLVTYFEESGKPNKVSQIEALICSSIYGGVSDTEIDNLPQKLQAIENSAVESEEQFAEVGQLTSDSQNAWSLYREVTTTESAWLSEQTLEDFVENSSFTPRQRIYLAAKIAIAHLHFATVNRGFSCRQLKNYHYFRQVGDNPHDWTIPFVSIPWLDYGFGSPVVNTGKIRLNAPAQEVSAKIDPAIELGVLLYQIMGSTKIQYSNVSELIVAGEEAASSLDKVSRLCGLPVMEIVETCFQACPPDERISKGQDAAFVVIEEVAAALVHLAKEFKELD